ncbi:hypothetical protein HYT53_04210 [Candidatus Woesearchaeota archaeon]|nr:hypothetical protein [Candidatus Woesearchaeota archaeon]
MATLKTLKRGTAGEPIKSEELSDKPRSYGAKKINLNAENIKTKEELLRELAKITEGYVGADIELVCREAAILALRENIRAREILPKHFEQALEKVRPSVTKEVQQTYEELRETLSAARAKQMLDEKPSYMG